ncbi:hypothetical protein [Fulvimarina manganoxydans]|uniref:hypothetical protein n=1 Tax=Fulvimarina manganoxydans TaxID=937218 RepID=UPI00111C0901|nr:hypothetical protein [Fulvimarina manganoxydans]
MSLDEFEDEVIRDEYEARFGAMAAIEPRNADRLAELIAEGATDEALDLLREIAPDTLYPSTIKRLVADRQHQRSLA